MYENLMEEVVSPENYGKALRAVIANDGAPGIDGMRTEELNGHLLKHWPKIHAKLMAGTYVPSPVRPERNPQRERRHADLRHSNGTGSVHPADVTAGHDTDLGAALQRTQLWVPAGAQGSRCRAGRTKVRREGQGLGRGFGYHQIFRSRQLGHPDEEDRASDPGQTGVEAHRAVSAGGRHGGRSGGQERGRNAARRAAVSIAGEHLSGRLRSGTGAARTFVQPVTRMTAIST